MDEEQRVKCQIERLQQLEARRAMIKDRRRERLLVLQLGDDELFLRRYRLALLRRWLRNLK